ncbi:MAG: hypothetical protein WCY88_00495 [Spongiibacteraceae bacterium]
MRTNDLTTPLSPVSPDNDATGASITDITAVARQAGLEALDREFKLHWNLGQNILLCWCLDSDGVQVLPAPHYFLGQFSASLNDCDPIDRLEALNGRYIRQLISGSRLLSIEDFHGAASRLELTPVKIHLAQPLIPDADAYHAIDALIKRYSINYVKSRAVLLFDIVDFSLVSPFEQTSQLNSLSYMMNVAHERLRRQNKQINFCRTTTGDGYYVWHQQESPRANLELFEFMMLVIVDNAMAQRAAHSNGTAGQVVPSIRTCFHIGGHFEFYQADGLNPGLNSFIVGDVTIELARMLELAEPGQIFIGDFDADMPTSYREGAYLIPVDSQLFIERAVKQMHSLKGETLSGQTITAMHCFLTGEIGASGGKTVRRFRITDKHGRSRNVYNLRINIRTVNSNKPVILGKQDGELSQRQSLRKGMISKDNRLRVFNAFQPRLGTNLTAADD